MADKFDSYREALVMETSTEWPEQFAELDSRRRAELESRLHATPSEASHIEYIRTHTGFCRRIVVEAADYARVSGS